MCPLMVEHDDEEVNESYWNQKLQEPGYKPKIDLNDLGMEYNHFEMFKKF